MSTTRTDTTRTYRVAGAQLRVEPDDVPANTAAIIDHITWAGREGADFIVFPEMMLTGYHGRFDQPQRDHAIVEIQHACRASRVTAIVGAGHKPRPGLCRIQAVVVDDRGGILGSHSKMVPTDGDRRFCTPGRRLNVFQHKGLTFGCLICNDMWVTPGCGPYADPRLSLQLAKRGAQVIFHLINSGSSKLHVPYHESNLQLRAREGGLHIVTANAAKPSPVNCSTGVVGPDGTWRVRVPRRGEYVYVLDIDVDAS